MMTAFEIAYLFVEPFFPPLRKLVRARLCDFAKSRTQRPDILDVGGRFSQYTLAVPANITITDLQCKTELQKHLHLGTTDRMMQRLARRRSNIAQIRYDDMTRSNLPDSSYDCVVAVEVLEHVEEDGRFVSEVARVLRPAGTFLLTTPNGDFVKNTNPDHKRHYTREQLQMLLAKHFTDVRVEYAVKTGQLYALSLRNWSAWHPVRTAVTMIAGALSTWESRSPAVKTQRHGTHQLIASAIARTGRNGGSAGSAGRG